MKLSKTLLTILCTFVFAFLITLLVTQQQSSQILNEVNRETTNSITNPDFIPELPVEKEPEVFKLLFVGDVMLDRSVGQQILQGQNPFEQVLTLFSEHDVVIANLETVAADPALAVKAPGKLYTFNSPVESLKTLKESGVDIVSMANNHTMDYGGEALLNTMKNLDEQGILHVGAGKDIKEAYKPLYKNVGSTKLAFISVNEIENYYNDATESRPGNAPMVDATLVTEAIKEARANADIVIILPHWGIEYDTLHSLKQEEWGKLFIDNGADAVIGAHPHVIQDSQEYKGKMIYYSLGNFVFDGMCGMPNACSSMALTMTITDGEITGFTETQIIISDNGNPSAL